MMYKIFIAFLVQIVFRHARSAIQHGEKISISSAHAHHVQPYVFEQQILEQLEKLRQFLKNGDPDAGIPPLEPINIDGFNYNFGINDSYFDGRFDRFVITNVSDFNVTDVRLKLIPLGLTLSVYFENLLFEGEYKIKGNLFEIALDGQGDLRDETRGLQVDLRIDISEKDEWVYFKAINANFSVKEVKISYTNGGESSTLPSDYTLELLNRIQTNYFPMLLNTLQIVVNDFFIGTTVDDIIHLITGHKFVENLVQEIVTNT